MRRTFVLGMGVQRSGTTWLHRALSSQEFSDFGPEKEYRVLHAIYEGVAEPRRKSIITEGKNSLESSYFSWTGTPKALKLAFLASPNAYFDFFSNLADGTSRFLTGDISSVYSTLSARSLVEIRRGFLERGVNVLPILIMRDPVYRLQSEVRAVFNRKDIIPTYKEEIDAMMKLVGNSDDVKRVDYAKTYYALQEAFQGSCLIFFFETFFQKSQINRIEECIGQRLTGMDFSSKLLASRGGGELTLSDYSDFRHAYKDVFDFAQKLQPLICPWGYKGNRM